MEQQIQEEKETIKKIKWCRFLQKEKAVTNTSERKKGVSPLERQRKNNYSLRITQEGDTERTKEILSNKSNEVGSAEQQMVHNMALYK